MQKNKISGCKKKMNEGEVMAGVGKVIQKIRVEHPRLVNHEFFKYFGQNF
jgi:hypothetical protein